MTFQTEKIEFKNEQGETLAARVEIKKQFLDDVRSISLEHKIERLKAALLIFHTPQDEVVSPEHARKIYDLAKDPKNIISLEGATHLLNKKEDSECVANIISAWAQRYLAYQVL